MAFDPRIVSTVPFVPHAYEAAFVTTPELYQNAVNRFQALGGVDTQRISYSVDSLRVTGVTVLPTHTEPGKHPILIFNRGGNRDYGRLLVTPVLRYMVPFAQKGYLVFASNYRGNDGGEGRDEFGGADLQDVLELLDIARHHPAWDGKNAYMLGVSRGGAMTYQAIRAHAAINAAVTIAGPAELTQTVSRRPEMLKVFECCIPEFARAGDHYIYDEAAREKALEARSALCWPEDINIPLLMLHGDADEAVHVSHSVKLAAALEKRGKQHKAVIYPGDNHSLAKHTREMLGEINAWFGLHKVE